MGPLRIALPLLLLVIAEATRAEPSHLPRVDPRRVLNGRRMETSELKFGKSVVALKGGGSTCSGTAIEGCVLTAGHCVHDDTAILEGTDVSSTKRSTSLGRIAESRSLGQLGKTDIAILKPKRMLSRAISQPKSILAKEEYDGTVNETRLSVVGWGNSETRETFDSETGEASRTDVGAGVKRYGRLTYGGKHEGMLRHTRLNTAQMTAKGDSGAPIFVEAEGGAIRLIAVLSAGGGYRLPGEKKEDRRDNDDTIGYSVPVSMHLAWILKTLKELDCVPGEAGGNALAEFIKTEFAPLKSAQSAWDTSDKWKAGASRLTKLKKVAAEELKARGELTAPSTHVRINVKVEGGVLKLFWWGMLAPTEAGDQQKIKDLGRSYSRPSGVLEFPIDG